MVTVSKKRKHRWESWFRGAEDDKPSFASAEFEGLMGYSRDSNKQI